MLTLIECSVLKKNQGVASSHLHPLRTFAPKEQNSHFDLSSKMTKAKLNISGKTAGSSITAPQVGPDLILCPLQTPELTNRVKLVEPAYVLSLAYASRESNCCIIVGPFGGPCFKILPAFRGFLVLWRTSKAILKRS